MTDQTELNLTEKRALGASFFAAASVIASLNDLAIIRMDTALQEKKARDIALKFSEPLKCEDTIRLDLKNLAEISIFALLKRLKDIPKREKNPISVAQARVIEAQYYLVSQMFDYAESRHIMQREDMNGTVYENNIPPRPIFPNS